MAVALLLLTMMLRRRGLLLVALGLTALLHVHGQWRLERLERHWTDAREARVKAASDRLEAELTGALHSADSLARRALGAASLPKDAGFRAVQDLIRGLPLESGVAVFEPGGEPRVWGGRFRVPPTASGDSIAARLTSYYAVLEVRRHAPSGHTALGVVFLAADPAVPDQDRSLAARFQDRTEVGLRILVPHLAPNSSDVFDYEQPTQGGPRTLFSAQLVPPEQGPAIARAISSGAWRVAWTLILTLFLALWLVPSGVIRIALALLPLAVALRAPLVTRLGLSQPFDPSLFSSAVLGPISRSAGPLALLGVVLLLLGALLWERGPARKLPTVMVGILLLVAAPYLMSELGRGIVPPAGGVPMGLWLEWHLTLFLFAAGLLTLAAALLRGRESPRAGWWAPALGAALALGAAAVGAVVWNARYGWHDLYTLVWLPPLVLVTLPANRRATILGIGIVAGSATALLTWGAEIEGRLRAARADMAALGDAPNPDVALALRALGDTLAAAPVPTSAPELYARWKASALSRQERPVILGLWHRDGTPELELPLDQLDLPHDVLGETVRRLPPEDSVTVLALQREPGLHQLLLVRRPGGLVLTVGIGPRSELVPPSRLGRLLAARSPETPLYRLTLAPARSTLAPDAEPALWKREAWQAGGLRTITIAGIPRDVYGTVELGSPARLVVRGVLVVVLDMATIAALWLLAALLGGLGPIRLARVPGLRSYEARLGAALGVFFLAPTVGFAGWGISRLRAEVRESRDRMIEQALTDVVPPGASLPADETALNAELHALGERADAAFALYRNGRQVAGSTGGLLESLGLIGPLMDPEAYHRIAIHGEAVASADGPSRAVASRIGYRAIRLSDQRAGALTMSQVAADPVLFERQRDLALIFLLAILAGVLASLVAARAAARVLARPVADLRDAALAFGKGDPAVISAPSGAAEFRPVFAAFEKMTEDVRKARDAQERVARIVAWGQMANQVAHEIKNPLTPMRLGVQHLRRVYRDGRLAGPVLEDTLQRILSEIDRLDRIARSFSRFGAPASDRGPLEDVQLPKLLREVADLYRLGEQQSDIALDTDAAEPVTARSDEVKETLVNLLENSRNAGATKIRIRAAGTTISVDDNGCGIAQDLLPMIFEPRWSTSTSGSGLGLPIVKRLVEGWGGRVTVESEVGAGTTVRLTLLPAAGGGPGPALEGGRGSVQAEQ